MNTKTVMIFAAGVAAGWFVVPWVLTMLGGMKK